MLENSVIIFTTDNGGPANGFDFNWANNYPLRGVKASLYEGTIIIAEKYPEPCQLSKMKLFTKKLNGFQPLTIFAKALC